LSLGYRQLTVYLYDLESDNQIARFDATQTIEPGTFIDLGTIDLSNMHISNGFRTRVTGGCYGSRGMPIDPNENSDLIFNLAVSDLSATSGKAKIPASDKSWQLTYQLDNDIADIDSLVVISGTVHTVWDWNLPINGNAKISFLGTDCDGQQLEVAIPDLTQNSMQVELDGCFISCNDNTISLIVDFHSPGSGTRLVTFDGSSTVDIILELDDLQAEWIAGRLHEYSVDFQDTIDLPENKEDYNDIPLNAFDFKLSIDNPFPIGGNATVNVYGDAPTPIILNFGFSPGITEQRFDEANSGLLTLLRAWPEMVNIVGTAAVSNSVNSLKWYPGNKIKVLYDLILPLVFSTEKRYYLETPVSSLNFNEDIIDTSEANIQSVALLARVTTNIPAEMTLTIQLDRDSASAINNPAWMSEQFELESGTSHDPSVTDWKVEFDAADFYLFSQGKLYYYAKVGFSTLQHNEWRVNTNQFVKVNTQIEATVRRDN
jgi:hypothetical protein